MNKHSFLGFIVFAVALSVHAVPDRREVPAEPDEKLSYYVVCTAIYTTLNAEQGLEELTMYGNQEEDLFRSESGAQYLKRRQSHPEKYLPPYDYVVENPSFKKGLSGRGYNTTEFEQAQIAARKAESNRSIQIKGYARTSPWTGEMLFNEKPNFSNEAEFLADETVFADYIGGAYFYRYELTSPPLIPVNGYPASCRVMGVAEEYVGNVLQTAIPTLFIDRMERLLQGRSPFPKPR